MQGRIFYFLQLDETNRASASDIPQDSFYFRLAEKMRMNFQAELLWLKGDAYPQHVHTKRTEGLIHIILVTYGLAQKNGLTQAWTQLLKRDLQHKKIVLYHLSSFGQWPWNSLLPQTGRAVEQFVKHPHHLLLPLPMSIDEILLAIIKKYDHCSRWEQHQWRFDVPSLAKS